MAFTGLTTLSWNASSFYLVSASIKLNDYNGLCPSPGGTSYNLYKNAGGYRQMACHEMGHALGIGHNSDVGGCLVKERQACDRPT